MNKWRIADNFLVQVNKSFPFGFASQNVVVVVFADEIGVAIVVAVAVAIVDVQMSKSLFVSSLPLRMVAVVKLQ